MFISYKYKNLFYKESKIHWEYELTDSEFGIVLGSCVWSGIWSDVIVCVIREYSKRNLNVAANLAVAFVWMHKQNSDFSIRQIIDNNKKYNLLPPQYEEDLQKYLVLL
jgi:hypothetical protein